jgi:hypothetical protein
MFEGLAGHRLAFVWENDFFDARARRCNPHFLRRAFKIKRTGMRAR